MSDLDELKRLVVSEKDTDKAFSYFFDLIDQDININDKPIDWIKENSELSAMIDAITCSVSKKLGISATISSTILFESPEYQFFHGVCSIAELPTSLPVLYFSSVQTGIFAMTGKGDTMEMFRFVLTKSSDMNKIH